MTYKDENEKEEIINEIYMSAVYGVTPDEYDAAKSRPAPDPDDTRVWKPGGEPELPEEPVAPSAPQPARRAARTDRGQKAKPAAGHGKKAGGSGAAGGSKKAREAKKGKNGKKKTPRQRIAAVLCAIMLVSGLYSIAVFSDIPFIKKWRDIYIETAMGTMTHQWLATYFIPGFVIDEVMGTRTGIEVDQDEIDTNWSADSLSGADRKTKWSKLEKSFFDIYSEIDEDSFEEYMESHAEAEALDDDGYLFIDQAGIGDEETGIETVHGDPVLAIDTKNGIVIIKISGSDYEGRLAIIKDPAQVRLGLSKSFGSMGQVVSGIAEDNDAVLAINASGFVDPDGHGNGGQVHGLVIKDGKTLSNFAGGNNKTIGFDQNDVLQIGKYKEKGVDLRDAVEFKPVLVLDGKKVIEGSAGWGIQPRTSIGQTKNGQVLMIVVDGRQVGYSIGCTMGDLADVMMKYGAYQAINLDGGSSSIMYYNGRKITKPSAANKEQGRYLPDAFIVLER